MAVEPKTPQEAILAAENERLTAAFAVGVTAVASCCGHGKGCGNIALADGRELVIAPSYEAACALEREKNRGG